MQSVPAKKTFWPIAKTAATILPGLGFREGAIQSVVQQRARGAEWQGISPREVVLEGVGGGISATILGAPIAAYKPTKPARSVVIEAVASMADVYEWPMDQVATHVYTPVMRRVARKTGRAFHVPVITTTTSDRDMASFTAKDITATPTRTEQPSAVKPKTSVQTPPADVVALTTIPTITPTITTTPTQPTATPTVTITPTPSTIPTITTTPTETITPTTTTTPTTITTTIPVVTPQLGRGFVPPLLPLGFPSFGAGAGTVKGKGKRYVQEISAARGAFGVLMSFGAPPKKKKTTDKKKTAEKMTEIKLDGGVRIILPARTKKKKATKEKKATRGRQAFGPSVRLFM